MVQVPGRSQTGSSSCHSSGGHLIGEPLSSWRCPRSLRFGEVRSTRWRVTSAGVRTARWSEHLSCPSSFFSTSASRSFDEERINDGNRVVCAVRYENSGDMVTGRRFHAEEQGGRAHRRQPQYKLVKSYSVHRAGDGEDLFPRSQCSTHQTFLSTHRFSTYIAMTTSLNVAEKQGLPPANPPQSQGLCRPINLSWLQEAGDRLK